MIKSYVDRGDDTLIKLNANDTLNRNINGYEYLKYYPNSNPNLNQRSNRTGLSELSEYEFGYAYRK